MKPRTWTLTIEMPWDYRAGRNGGWHKGEPAHVPVLWIEYEQPKVDLFRPFAIYTACSAWDVDWCERDATCYYHDVGSGLWLPRRQWSGGTMYSYPGRGKTRRTTTSRPGEGVEFFGIATVNEQMCCETEPGSRWVWWERGAVDIHRRDGVVRNVERFLLSRGYVPAGRPLPLDANGTINPFETSDYRAYGDTPCVYCRVCDDHFPESEYRDPCKHLWWCEECGDWSGRGADDRCKHRRRRA